MSYFYLASPYTSRKKKKKDRGLEQDLRYGIALRATHKLHMQGLVVFSPIVHYHNIALYSNLPGTYEYWKDVNATYIKRSNGLFVLTINGWKQSVGVQDEIKLARSLRLPVFYYDPYPYT